MVKKSMVGDSKAVGTYSKTARAKYKRCGEVGHRMVHYLERVCDVLSRCG